MNHPLPLPTCNTPLPTRTLQREEDQFAMHRDMVIANVVGAATDDNSCSAARPIAPPLLGSRGTSDPGSTTGCHCSWRTGRWRTATRPRRAGSTRPPRAAALQGQSSPKLCHCLLFPSTTPHPLIRSVGTYHSYHIIDPGVEACLVKVGCSRLKRFASLC